MKKTEGTTGRQLSKEQTWLQSYRWHRAKLSFKNIFFYNGQKIILKNVSSDAEGEREETLSLLVEPCDRGGPEAAIIRTKEIGQKDPPPSIRTLN